MLAIICKSLFIFCNDNEGPTVPKGLKREMKVKQVF